MAEQLKQKPYTKILSQLRKKMLNDPETAEEFIDIMKNILEDDEFLTNIIDAEMELRENEKLKDRTSDEIHKKMPKKDEL